MLDNGFTASEGARHGGHTALGNREEGIHNPLSGHKRSLRRQFFEIWTAFADRPFLHHRKLPVAFLGGDDSHCFLNGEFTAFNLFYRTFDAVGNHNFLDYDYGFLDGSEDIAGLHLVAGLYGGNKLPFFITFQGRNLNPPLQVVASGRLHDIIQRSLDPVINTGDQARPEFHRQRNLHRFHRFPRSESGGLLIYLNGGFVSVHLNYLTDQTLAAYTDHVEHVGISHPLCNYQGACHFFNRTFAHWKVTPTFLNL